VVSSGCGVRGELPDVDVVRDSIVRLMGSDMCYSNFLIQFLAARAGDIDVTRAGDLFVRHLRSIERLSSSKQRGTREKELLYGFSRSQCTNSHDALHLSVTITNNIGSADPGRRSFLIWDHGDLPAHPLITASQTAFPP
jgi:hypothetical protein